METLHNQDLVQCTALTVERKLAEGAANGAGGWNDPAQCSLNKLHRLAQAKMDEHDFEGALIYTAMLVKRLQMEPEV